IKMGYIGKRGLLEYDLPMSGIVMGIYDKLKSTTKGYASFDYVPVGFRPGILKKLDVRVAGDVDDALSIIVPEAKAV
ncbi:elongation factor 4, partial [Aliarcobacter butzleri]